MYMSIVRKLRQNYLNGMSHVFKQTSLHYIALPSSHAHLDMYQIAVNWLCACEYWPTTHCTGSINVLYIEGTPTLDTVLEVSKHCGSLWWSDVLADILGYPWKHQQPKLHKQDKYVQKMRNKQTKSNRTVQIKLTFGSKRSVNRLKLLTWLTNVPVTYKQWNFDEQKDWTWRHVWTAVGPSFLYGLCMGIGLH